MLEEGDLDAIIGFKETPAAKISASYREIAKVPMVCACAPRHPLAKEKAVCLDCLKEERLAMFAPIMSSHPDIPLIAKIPVADAEPVSFGVYYKSLQGNPALKTFLKCAKEYFAN